MAIDLIAFVFLNIYTNPCQLTLFMPANAISIPRENVRKPKVFRGIEIGHWREKGLILGTY